MTIPAHSVYVNAGRTVMVAVDADANAMTVAVRDDPQDVWGPPTQMIKEKSYSPVPEPQTRYFTIYVPNGNGKDVEVNVALPIELSLLAGVAQSIADAFPKAYLRLDA